jgi:ribosomal protein S18 acetylase RimI-like enzyme
MPAVLELWGEDVREGRRDCVPGKDHLRRLMAGFQWDVQSRIIESSGSRVVGAALVFRGAGQLGTVAMVDASAARSEQVEDLTRWGLGLSRAAGAIAAQVWRGRGHTGGLARLGMELVRPWWRMDRSLETEPVASSPVAGYGLRDARDVPSGWWAEVHNGTFADHWRFSPRTEDELMAGRPAELSVMAIASGGAPVALTLSQIEVYRDDPRTQPVGMISSVGTLPGHRRHGLASWLVAETLLRLHGGGARCASLYVDGMSPVRAFDVYRNLGFELAFETEVWEATFR